ncbi:MAG: bifunctional homocysteine S-methyltransferase/methylenetetrahydrofolate reductase [Anaerolineae bacterium]|nr:MAG: bifunctional homocysteine S-methyltransferase/methylenetetrahydrofolate reductase [Anaerolineae bacterium]
MSMTRDEFLAFLDEQVRPVLADGAMGTMLHERGIGFDECFDALNLTNPAVVGDIHRAYIEAGAQIIYTNTFGANRYKLAEHGLEAQVVEINRKGVELAQRVVAASFRPVLVAGDVGPLGVRLAPYGRVQPQEARAAFAEQIAALCQAGADLIVLETFSDLYEIREAVAAARQVCDLAVVASVTFTRDDRTLLGDTPAAVARALMASGADVIGANCSGGPAQLQRVLEQMRQAAPQARFLIKPNAGWPEQVAGRVMYTAHPDYFADYAETFARLGVRLMGGCCGTTPQHIAAMRARLDALPPDLEIQPIVTSPRLQPRDLAPKGPTRLAQRLAEGKFTVAVEMDPPRGLAPHKLLAGASLLKEAGADVINVADSPMARMRMSPWAVCDLIQRNVGIETTLHFPTRGRNLLRVQGDLLAAHALDIRNVFVVMGDPTAIGDYPDAMDDYDLAPSGLIKLIKQGFNMGVDHAGSDIGQPTTFFVGCALNLLPANPQREMKVLRRKIRNGADFALTQPIYDPRKAHEFLQRYEETYGPLEIPILAGILPLYTARHAAFLQNEVPGIIIPPEVMSRIEAAGDAAAEEGKRIAIELAQAVKPWAAGIYIMPPFHRYDLVAEIIEAVKDD